MRKRFLSLLCVLALCLTLLPATALAAENAPTTLYVGNYQITNGNATTYLKAGSTQGSLVEGSENDWTVKYDPSTATLTLNGATITGNDNISSVPYGAGIYAQCNSGQPVTLTIELIGENTITGNFGIYVNAEMSANSYGTDASLNITGNGSLIVTGTNSHGLFVKSGTGDASLNINDASVVASSSSSYSGYAGVYVQSSVHATSSPQLSLKVNGGSLTASGGDSGAGIQFNVASYIANNATTSLTVNNNAIVKAINGIEGYYVDKPIPSGTGIVFDDKEGTVYGDVTLDESLTINQGETLTIPGGSSLNANDKLTNDGTINVENGGNLEGEPTSGTGTVVSAPKITTESLDSGTVGAAYSQALQADNAPTLWSITSGSLPDGLNLSGSTISGTPTTAGTSTFTVKAENSAGSDSKEYTLTIQSATVPVTGVKLNTETLELFTSNTATLTATVQPGNATNKNVTWSSNNAEVATVEGGTVTAVGAGETTITVQTQDGNHTATCTVKVTQSAYSISADTTALNFGSVYTGYAQPAAQTVTVENTGNQTLTLTQPASTGSFEVGSLSKSELTAGEKATFTVQPKAGLAVGTYSENITVSGTGGATVTITASFTVKQYSSGGSSSSTPSVSDQAIDKIEAAKDGSTVSIKLPVGRTTLEGEVFETLAGQDITLEISLSNGVTWTVNGQDIPKNAKLSDLDLGVTLDASTIPVSVINTITGTVDTIQISLKHDGEFGFTMTLSAPLGRDNADYWANLYWYNERTEELEFQQAARIARDGTAEFALDHASDYAIVIDDRSHEPVDLPFNDVPEGYWAYDAIQYVYGEGLMAGTSGSTFNPEGTTTRGQIVTILWRLSGSPVVNYLMDFDDVDPAAYYAEAIRWATSEGIAGGYGGGLFGPDDPITREQLAVMLHRYAQHQGFDVSIGEDTNILSYADAFTVSEYAVSALQWACGAGIISGTGDGSTLTPQGEATRAQAAVMLQRFCEQYEEN